MSTILQMDPLKPSRKLYDYLNAFQDLRNSCCLQPCMPEPQILLHHLWYQGKKWREAKWMIQVYSAQFLGIFSLDQNFWVTSITFWSKSHGTYCWTAPSLHTIPGDSWEKACGEVKLESSPILQGVFMFVGTSRKFQCELVYMFIDLNWVAWNRGP